jgi:hypothetical protein
LPYYRSLSFVQVQIYKRLHEYPNLFWLCRISTQTALGGRFVGYPAVETAPTAKNATGYPRRPHWEADLLDIRQGKRRPGAGETAPTAKIATGYPHRAHWKADLLDIRQEGAAGLQGRVSLFGDNHYICKLYRTANLNLQ